MLCDRCKQTETCVHLIQIVGDSEARFGLCQECAQGIESSALTQAGWTSYSHSTTRKELLHSRLGTNPPYPIEAFELVIEALEVAVGEAMADERLDRPRHVSGRELSDAFRKTALSRFGTNAKAQLKARGILQTDDVGAIVFHLVNAGLLGASPMDAKEDFVNVYDFDQAFPEN